MPSRSILVSTVIGALAVYSGCSAGEGAGTPGGGGSGTGASAGNGGNAGVAGTPNPTGGAAGAAGAAAGGAGAGVGGQGGGAAGTAGGLGGGGTGGGAPAPVTPTEASGVYTWSYGDVVFKVNAMVGGRITSFSKGGVEVLDSDDASNYGSTFWSSPQSAWNWPPPPEIDNAAYTATLEGATLVLVGSANAALGLSASKRFTVDSTCDCVDIQYSLTNSGAAPVSAAPWEVTRVDIGGLTFFPAPAMPHKVDMALAYTYDATGQRTWFDYASVTGQGKLYQDGGAWLGHAKGTLLFLKKFPDITAGEMAPAHGQVEVYTNGSSYVELENQGAYGSIGAGASVTYDVRWYLRTIPETVTVASGSQTLYDFAAALAQ